MTALRYACPDCGFRLMTPRRCGGCQAKHDAETRVPERIQLRRTRGWRKPEGAIVVARPSKWGNPYRLDEYCDDYAGATEHDLRRMATSDFRGLLEGRWERDEGSNEGSAYPTLDEIRAELRGHDLACWCPLSSACHADVLLEIANA